MRSCESPITDIASDLRVKTCLKLDLSTSLSVFGNWFITRRLFAYDCRNVLPSGLLVEL